MTKSKTTTKTSGKSAATTSSEPKDYKYDFIKLAPLMGGISLLLTVVSIALFVTKGFNYGIDFAGGTEIQVKFDQAVTAEQLRAAVNQAVPGEPTVQGFGGQSEFLIRLGMPEGSTDAERNQTLNASIDKLKTTLAATLNLKPEGVLRVDTVGPQVGSELKKNGLLAAFYCFLVILIYVSIRFDYAYAPGAVLCLVHDSILTLGLFSFLGREVNVQIMAAVLTLIGYSLNDTIVTFDRIREKGPESRGMSLSYVINKAINDMLGRTFLTMAMTLGACVGLYLYGGGVIEDIAFTLIVGILVGTYSSVYVAAPLIIVMDKLTPAAMLPRGEASHA